MQSIGRRNAGIRTQETTFSLFIIRVPQNSVASNRLRPTLRSGRHIT